MNRGDQTVSVIATADNTVRATIPVGARPISLVTGLSPPDLEHNLPEWIAVLLFGGGMAYVALDRLARRKRRPGG